MRPFIYLAVIISLVAGQANLNTLPLCAIVCVGAGINGTGCAATNIHCFCSSTSLLEIAVPCIAQNCSLADQSKTETGLKKICNSASPAVTLPAFSSILAKKTNSKSSTTHPTSSASHVSSVSARASSVSSSASQSSLPDASSVAPTASASGSSSGLSGATIGGIAAACVLAGIILLTFIGGLIYRRRVRKKEELELKDRFSDQIPFSANLRYPYFEGVSEGEQHSARLQNDSDAAIKKMDVVRVPIPAAKPKLPGPG